jgi:hypothetical protein
VISNALVSEKISDEKEETSERNLLELMKTHPKLLVGYFEKFIAIKDDKDKHKK